MFNSKQSSSSVYYRNVSKTIKQIYYNEGMKAFMKGVIPRMITVFPSMGISWCAYEFLKNKLSQNLVK